METEFLLTSPRKPSVRILFWLTVSITRWKILTIMEYMLWPWFAILCILFLCIFLSSSRIIFNRPKILLRFLWQFTRRFLLYVQLTLNFVSDIKSFLQLGSLKDRKLSFFLLEMFPYVWNLTQVKRFFSKILRKPRNCRSVLPFNHWK